MALIRLCVTLEDIFKSVFRFYLVYSTILVTYKDTFLFFVDKDRALFKDF